MKKIQQFFALFSGVLILGLASCGNDDSSSPAPEPYADFTITNNGCAGPCTVTFTNTSEDATTYSWNFGDSSAFSTLTSPTHEYTAPGTYTVTLTAKSSGGIDTYSRDVTIAEPAGPEFYITYTVGNVTTTLTEVSATRGTNIDNENTLRIFGSKPGGANPKFDFFSIDGGIGFEPGLTVGSDYNSDPYSVVKYTNEAGTLFSTENSADGVYLSLFEASYVNGGIMKGIFSGTVETGTGNSVTFTEGKFRVKITN